jgi:hypothetical protein
MTIFEALYYEIPIANSSFATVNANFFLVSYLSASWTPKHNWVLIAVMNSDSVGGGVKWMAGNTVIPLPSSGNTNTWSPNITQLGTGANQLTINGSTGIISAPTINATSLQEGGVDIDTKFAPIVNPTFSGAVISNFVAFRAFSGGTLYRNLGQQSITNSNISLSATGTYLITIPNPHPYGANYGVVGSTNTNSGQPNSYLTATINSSTQFTVFTYSNSGVLSNQQFTVMTLS